jgi:hypothetical protein
MHMVGIGCGVYLCVQVLGTLLAFGIEVARQCTAIICTLGNRVAKVELRLRH